MVQQQDMELEGMNPDEDILGERVASECAHFCWAANSTRVRVEIAQTKNLHYLISVA
jgi:hypothetical protein